MPEIPDEDLSRMQNRLAELEAFTAQREAAEQAAKARLMLQQGQHEALLATHRQQLDEANKRAAKYAVSTELTRALVAHPLIPRAAEQLHALLEDECVADPSLDGGFTVRSKTYESIDKFVASRLEHPHFQHFLRANNRPAAPASHLPQAQTTAPTNVTEAILADHKERLAAMPTSDPRLDMKQAMGLRKRK